MKALVLSGGKGTRLKPLTYTAAKQLVPVANRPILFYVLDNLQKAGIQEVGIVISPQTGAEIQKVISEKNDWSFKITYILQEEPLGLAHAVLIAQHFLGDSPFIMYLGDNLIGCEIGRFVQHFEESKANAFVLLKQVDNPSQFGVAQLGPNGVVTQLVEKPKEPLSKMALVGVYIFSPQIHSAIAELKPSARGELEITDAIQKLIDQKYDVRSHVLHEWWLDTGKKDDLLAANRQILDTLQETQILGNVDKASIIEGRVFIGKGSTITGSRIRGPVVIGDHVTINESFIGPYTSIGDQSIIEYSVLDHSVLLEGCQLSHVDRLEDSLCGKNVIITKAKGNHHRVLLGDDSHLEI